MQSIRADTYEVRIPCGLDNRVVPDQLMQMPSAIMVPPTIATIAPPRIMSRPRTRSVQCSLEECRPMRCSIQNYWLYSQWSLTDRTEPYPDLAWARSNASQPALKGWTGMAAPTSCKSKCTSLGRKVGTAFSQVQDLQLQRLDWSHVRPSLLSSPALCPKTHPTHRHGLSGTNEADRDGRPEAADSSSR
jgi:hypothetical protein